MSDEQPRRTEAEVQIELAALTQAHIQNETARDAFLALGHTALFAASVSFIGDLAEKLTLQYLWMLMIGWLASVLGLCSLTLSYSEAARYIRKRNEQVYKATPDGPGLASVLNGIALWTFPTALVSTFLFASANLLSMPDKASPTPPPPAVPTTRGVTPPPRAPSPGGPQTGVIPAPRAPSPPPPPPPPAKD